VRVEYSYAFFCLPTASLLKDTDERRWESGLRPPLSSLSRDREMMAEKM